MRSPRILLSVGLLIVLTAILAACGSTTTASSGTTPATNNNGYGNSQATPTATSSNNNGYGNSQATPTTSSTNATSIQTATATVNGKSVTILADSHGMTLYYFTPDTSTTAACTGQCAVKWPPLLTTGSSAPTSATALSGKLTTLATANGTQVQYNGHFLYTYAGDSAAGQTTGEGLGGKWYVATTDLT